MSNYTESMVTAMLAQAVFSFDDAVKFAEENQLSTRSVVSKVKSLGLEYTPKPKAAKSGLVKVTKADTVQAIAIALGASFETLEGLKGADAKSLSALLGEVS